jgi:DNA-binding transcriptional LysR family regulator
MASSDSRLGAIDLNLLVIFDAVMRERNVTRAAGGLGLSQSAISHALARLRHMLKDDLFVRSPSGMIPTPRAVQLALPVRAALDNLQRSLEPPNFDPAATPKTFKIAADNYGALVLAGPIATRMMKIAPNVMFEFYPSGTRDVIGEMDRGELDLTICALPDLPERFSSLSLMSDEFIAVLREGHALGAPTLSIEAIAAIPHLDFTSIRYNTDFIDEALAKANLKRRIAMRAPMLTFVRILLDSDLLAILPHRIAHNITQNRPLAIHRLPCTSPPTIETAMVWPRWMDDHQAHRWLRDHIVEISRDVAQQIPQQT